MKEINEERDGIFFFPELLYYTKYSSDEPWLRSKIEIPLLANNWLRVKDELVCLLKNRNNEIGPQMLKGLELYFTLLFWSNNKPVQIYEWEKHVKLLEYKSVNVEERLGFILAKYRTYPAFIQLAELFIEQQKHYVGKMAKEKYKQK